MKLNKKLLIRMERRSVPPVFIAGDNTLKIDERKALFRATGNINTGNSGHKKRWKATHIKLPRYNTSPFGIWNVHTLNKCEKLKELSTSKNMAS